jgi:hypothetical protein
LDGEEVRTMEAIFLSVLVLLLFVIGGFLVNHLADQEKAGKRFFWTESSLPEAELRDFLPRGVGRLHAT